MNLVEQIEETGFEQNLLSAIRTGNPETVRKCYEDFLKENSFLAECLIDWAYDFVTIRWFEQLYTIPSLFKKVNAPKYPVATCIALHVMDIHEDRIYKSSNWIEKMGYPEDKIAKLMEMQHGFGISCIEAKDLIKAFE